MTSTHVSAVLGYLRENTGGCIQDEVLLHIAALTAQVISSDLHEVGHDVAAEFVDEFRRHLDNAPTGASIRPPASAPADTVSSAGGSPVTVRRTDGAGVLDPVDAARGDERVVPPGDVVSLSEEGLPVAS